MWPALSCVCVSCFAYISTQLQEFILITATCGTNVEQIKLWTQLVTSKRRRLIGQFYTSACKVISEQQALHPHSDTSKNPVFYFVQLLPVVAQNATNGSSCTKWQQLKLLQPCAINLHCCCLLNSHFKEGLAPPPWDSLLLLVITCNLFTILW